jgi:glycosyltransferase involved in cell wall biosynthesis
MLQAAIEGYRVFDYEPGWEFFPFALPVVAKMRTAEMIHTTPDYAAFFHQKKIPLVVTIHNFVLDRWMFPYSSRLQRLHYRTDLRLFTKAAFSRACAVTAVSRFAARIAAEEMRFDGAVRVIYNGIDTARFTPPASAKTASDKINVFFSGNQTMRKGAHWLPKIAARLSKGIRILYTAGLRRSPKLEAVHGMVPVGSVPYGKMPDRYREMDILLMPTVREGFGLAVAEAMACGLPVVASDCSAIPELVDHGKGGFLCPVGNVAAFSERINQLAESPSLRRQMGEYNRAKIEKHFALESMVARYRQLFEEVIEKRP